ncbi:MAG: amino acid adenylation domain-containing protein [Pseudomonadota bacterium]
MQLDSKKNVSHVKTRYLSTHPAIDAFDVSLINKTLIELLLTRASIYPAKTVYYFLNEDSSVRTITWKELFIAARQVAIEISTVADRGDRVVLLYSPSIDYVIGFLGCLIAGVIAVPCYPPRNKRNSDRIINILNDCSPKLILTQQGLSDRLRSQLPDYQWLETLFEGATQEGPIEIEQTLPALDDIAFLQYTSGSTGTPKGVMVSHRNLVSNIALIHSTFQLTENSVIVTWLPPYHDMGLVWGLLQVIYSGCTTVIFEPTSFLQQPIKWLKAISDYKATHSGAPNFAYELCANRITEQQKAGLDLSSWDVAFCGAEPIRANTLHRFYQSFKEYGFCQESFLPCYGLAEATLLVSTAEKKRGATTTFCSERDNKVLVSTGFAAARNVAVVNPDSHLLLPEGGIGEIWVSGETVALGYWQKPELTKQTFYACIKGEPNSPYFLRTGDLGFIKNGELYIAGRLKDLIIINGRNIYPQDIEAVSCHSDSRFRLDGTAAFSIDVNDVSRLAVIQELDFRQKINEAMFGNIAKAISDEIGTPPDIIILTKAGTIPRTSSGKIRRQQCRVNFQNGDLPILGQWGREHSKTNSIQTKHFDDCAQNVCIPTKSTSTTTSEMEVRISAYLAARYNLLLSNIDRELPFAYYGLTSIDAVELAAELETSLSRPVSPTVFWEHPTIAQLSAYLASEITNPNACNSQQKQYTPSNEPIAIIGLGCRLPGSDTPDAFWQSLCEGVDAIRMPPDNRYDAQTFINRHPDLPHLTWAGFLDQVDQFDAQFFGIASYEAPHIDPQQRLLMEVAWEALENAGIAAAKLANTETGVFIGISTRDYEHIQQRSADDKNIYMATGSATSIAANRLSYLWDLRGPSIAVDTACSSSLSAVHLACQSLRTGDSNLAIAGGVNVILSTDSSMPFAQAGMLAADGRCKTFDVSANGYVRGEGCGILILKRLSDAQCDGDPIHALILGSATGQDGRSNGLIAPNGNAQTAVIRRALTAANVTPQQISYVETHGTGTVLGDPIELNALKAAFLPNRFSNQHCFLGSVKTNIGHLEAAAGIAGLLKVVLSLKHKKIPANLHYHAPNPHCSIDGTPLTVPTQLQSWNCHYQERYAGISSFGFGGSLAHVILAEAPQMSSSHSNWPLHLLTFSAKTLSALENMTDALASTLRENPHLSLADVSYTHQLGRNTFGNRRVLICRDREDAIVTLAHRDPKKLITGNAKHCPSSIAFMFPGEATHLMGKAYELYQHMPVFRTHFDACAEILQRQIRIDIREILYVDNVVIASKQTIFEQVEVVQSTLFAIEYALAKLWMEFGCKPTALIGNGIGEYVAACIAGVFSLDDALALIIVRGRFLTEQSTDDATSAAKLNQKQSLESFKTIVTAAIKNVPAIPFISNVTGTWIDPSQAIDPNYWIQHLNRPAQLKMGVLTLAEEPDRTLIELGPTDLLGKLAREHNHATPKNSWKVFSTLGHGFTQSSDLAATFDSLGKLWLEGQTINWAGFYTGQQRQRISLPTYPFERERYWIEPSIPLSTHSTQTQSFQSSLSQTIAEMGINMNATEISPTAKTSENRCPTLESELRILVAETMRIAPSQIDPHTSLLELGADSLVLIQAVRKIERTFGVSITIRQLFEDFTTIAKIALYLNKQLPISPNAVPNGEEKKAIIPDQSSLDVISSVKPELTTSTPSLPTTQNVEGSATHKPYVPYQQIQSELKTDLSRALTSQQSLYLDGFIKRYTESTRTSKELTQRYRPVLSDNRAAAGFRFSVKEMLYPIISKRSEGAHIWDADGNKYIDLTMGFGVNLFGHRPAFIEQALEKQLKCGMELGPQTQLAGEVAGLFCSITGMERLTFCNSGTEAVMLAMRLARTITKRDKIAIFTGSYHGWSDNTLAIPDSNQQPYGAAMAPGVSVENTLVLEYGSPHSLEIIRAHAHELAAILVEPVQSRRPDFQPRDFLHSLRLLTQEQQIVLIFDEVITGFRLHVGGAQAWYGIKADIGVYGKILGGGMPVGVVAGSAKYLDTVDGGQWQYGDVSYPQTMTTFFAGTFCKHPLTLAATRAVLQKLQTEGPELQEQLNLRTTALVERLNKLFTDGNLPIEVVHCGSLFRFNSSHNIDLLFYHAAMHGLYIWEGRNMFISTAHTQQDVDRIIEAFEACIHDLREGGFFPTASKSAIQLKALSSAENIKPESLIVAHDVSIASAMPIDGNEVIAIADAEENLQCLPASFWNSHKNNTVNFLDETFNKTATSGELHTRSNNKPMCFSISFFGNYEADYDESKYKYLLDNARFADTHGFTAVWIPERHFHAFGGLSPNPAILAAAIAMETQHIQLRAGSVVLPLHHPIRVAEEWSMVDNLSGGRTGIAFASGWHPNDFVLAPEAYGDHRELMFKQIEQVKSLWRGEHLTMRNGADIETNVKLFPMPKQADLPIWITIVNNPETYERAGAIGAGILTNLMGQTVDDLARNIARYHDALERNGHDRTKAKVTVLLHTFVGADAKEAQEQARQPLINYLRSSLELFETLAKSLDLQSNVKAISEVELDYLLGAAYERYIDTRALIGDVNSCAGIVRKLESIGVDEIGCFIDFGVKHEMVQANLPHLSSLLQHTTNAAVNDQSFQEPISEAVTTPELFANSQNIYPLTTLQQGIWFECQLNEEVTLRYNTTAALRLHGELRHQILIEALHHVVARHPALHSVISPSGDSQQVLAMRSIEVPIVDLTCAMTSSSAFLLQQWLLKDARRPFDLEQGPLIRMHLLKLGNEEHVLVLSLHHIVTDGLSQSLLLKEIGTCYRALCQGYAIELPPALPFSAYVAQEQAYFNDDQFQQDEFYWHEQFVNEIPKTLALPTDRPYGLQTTTRAAQQSATIDGNLKAQLQRLAVTNGCTLFMTLLSTFTTLMHRLTQQEDLVVGVPMIADRTENEKGNLVGCTVNVAPIRCRPQSKQSFIDHLGDVKHSLLTSANHIKYPFGPLVRKLNLPRDPNRRPLTSVLFNMDNMVESLDFGDLKNELIPSPLLEIHEDLIVDIAQLSDRLEVKFTYKQDLFDHTTINRWMNHFLTLIRDVVEHPSVSIGDLTLLEPKIEHQLLVDWNATDVTFPEFKGLHQLFEVQVVKTPESIAVAFENQFLTYAELNNRANQLAHYLSGCGVGPEVLVGIYVDRSIEMVIGLLAILKAGGAYVPLDPSYPHERLQIIIADLASVNSSSVLLTQSSLAARLSTVSATLISLDADAHLWSSNSIENPRISALAEQAAYVIYTSGSTGQPKGVINTHGGIFNRLSWMQDTYSLTDADRVLQKTPLSFDVSVWELFWPLLAGARLIIAQPQGHKDGQYLVDVVTRYGVTIAHFVPSMLNLWLDVANVERCTSIKQVFCSGEALSYATQEHFFKKFNAQLHNLYGPTEAAVDVTYWKCQRQQHSHTIPIGRPIANTQIYLLDNNLKPVPIGVPGEIFISGAGLARGYLNRSDLTAERFIENPFDKAENARMYRTGDLARYLPDGNIEYLGRFDHQIKIRGVRIELGEIEAVLSSIAGVREAIVITREEEATGEKFIVANVVAHGAMNNNVAMLRESLSKSLPNSMLPKHFVFLDRLPLTPNGKVDRQALLTANISTFSLAKTYVRPRTSLEQTVVSIWTDVLNLKQVSGHDNFFDLGGDSMLAIRVQNKLEIILKQEVAIMTLFQYPTVISLAHHLSQLHEEKNTYGTIDKRVQKAKAAREKRKHLTPVAA